MDRLNTVLLGIIVVIFDIVSGLVGLKAQSFLNRAKHDDFDFEYKELLCHEAFRYGIAAFIILTAAHAITIAFSCNMSARLKKLSPIFQILLWMTFFPTWVILFVVTIPNSHSCSFLHFQLLSVGGIGCFIYGACCMGYYFCAAVAIHLGGDGRSITRQTPA